MLMPSMIQATATTITISNYLELEEASMRLNLGQACRIMGVVLHGTAILLECSGNVMHFQHILHIMLEFDSGSEMQAKSLDRL